MTLEAVCLFEGLRRKLGGLDGRFLMHRFLKILAAAVVMALPLAFLDRQFSAHLEGTRMAFLLELALLLPAAVLMFIAACKFFRVEEIRDATRLLLEPLRRYTPLLSDRIRS
jgi:hypothetical protein